MKELTEGQRQWVWFGALWCVGIGATLGLAWGARWVLSVV